MTLAPSPADSSYTPLPDLYDEMQDGDGIRPHWREFALAFQQMGAGELQRRGQEIQRLLRQNGVTFNLHRVDQARDRPWDMDPVPFIVDGGDWERIEAGLVQRAELLDLVLRDLYGRRELLELGLLPPELVYGHGGFLVPANGSMNPQKRQLLFYAADLARGPDGRMWVLSDRAQAPTGAGYALENRTTGSRVLDDLLGNRPVRRLSFFFSDLSAALVRAAGGKADPRIVVLSAGPQDGTYFEHAYLASYLGYTLVQGDDLTVRDGRVWLKALDGLQPVDVIFRRMDAALCDPLELDGAAPGGVPGLLEAVRQGSVAVVNPLGSGVLENPGLMAFLPSIARHFLDEELKLPSAATWWCGQPREREHVLENLETLVIKPIYSGPDGGSVLGSQLTQAELAAWRQRIRNRPQLYVGQEQVDFSTAPSLTAGGMEPRHVILRTFLVAKGQTEKGQAEKDPAGKGPYSVLPGGLARSARQRDNFVVNSSSQSLSKDVWVLTEQPERPLSLWLRPDEDMPRAVTGTLPSRAAENLFWVGRYAERAEGGARWLRTVLRLHIEFEDFSDAVSRQAMRLLLRGLTLLTATKPGFIGRGASQRLARPEAELKSVALKVERAGSIAASVNGLIGATHAVRDRWSTDALRVLDAIEAHWNQGQTVSTLGQVRNALDQLVIDLVAFTGLNMESMTRALGWTVLDIGRRLERAQLLCVALRACAVPRQAQATEDMALEGLLTAQESLITYRNRYRSYLHLETVLDLLLLDSTNPRSLLYQLTRLEGHIDQLPRTRRGNRLSAEESAIAEAVARLRLTDPQALVLPEGAAGRRKRLDLLLTQTETALAQVSDMLNQTYFAHARQSHSLTGPAAAAGALP